MYQHYRRKEKIELISISGRDDEINKKILDGEYIKGERNDLIKLIFSDWIGDENDYLYIGDNILQYPIFDGDDLREKSLYERYVDGEYILGLRDVILNETIYTLSDGQYVEDGEIKTKDRPEGVQIEWDWETKEWVEKGTIDMVKFEVDSLKTKILEDGYEWNGYRQKCRDKDISLINSTLEALNYAVQINPDEKVTWYFNDSTSLVIGTSELTDLRQKGFKFIQCVYDVENRYKKGGVQKHTLEQYRLDVETLMNK